MKQLIITENVNFFKQFLADKNNYQALSIEEYLCFNSLLTEIWHGR